MKARDMKGEVVGKLEKVEDLGEVRTVLESVLFRLQNMQGNSTASNSEVMKDGQGEAAITDGDGVAEANGRATSPSPLPASKLNIVFDERLGKEKDRGKLVRYQINPRANWGPMNRAGGSI